MTQSPLFISNKSAPEVRTDLNTALAALATLSTGDTAPASTFPNQLWYDTTANVLKKRNAANTAWENFNVAIGVPLDSADADLSVDPDAAARRDIVAAAIPTRAWVNFNGTGTVAIRESLNVSSITDNAAGDYIVNFSASMADANFAAIATGTVLTGTTNSVNAITKDFSASAVGVVTTQVDGSANVRVDVDTISVAIFR